MMARASPAPSGLWLAKDNELIQRSSIEECPEPLQGWEAIQRHARASIFKQYRRDVVERAMERGLQRVPKSRLLPWACISTVGGAR